VLLHRRKLGHARLLARVRLARRHPGVRRGQGSLQRPPDEVWRNQQRHVAGQRFARRAHPADRGVAELRAQERHELRRPTLQPLQDPHLHGDAERPCRRHAGVGLRGLRRQDRRAEPVERLQPSAHRNAAGPGQEELEKMAGAGDGGEGVRSLRLRGDLQEGLRGQLQDRDHPQQQGGHHPVLGAERLDGDHALRS